MQQNILYDTYSISTKGKSKKEILSLLADELASYGYVSDKHISVSKISGYSFVDMVINEVQQESFLFITQTKDNKCYLLIYIDENILFSGEIKKFEIETKLALYAYQLNEHIVFYHDKYNGNCLNGKETQKISPKIYDENNLELFKLESVIKIRAGMASPVNLIIWLVGIVALLIIGAVIVRQINQSDIKLAMETKTTQVQDPWLQYRQAIKQPKAYTTINDIFLNTNDLRAVGQIAIKSITFMNNEITVDIANFGHSSFNFVLWSGHHHYKIKNYNSNSFELTKGLTPRLLMDDNKIMLVDQVKQRLIDRINQLNDPNITIAFPNDATRESNFTTMDCELNLGQIPIRQITDLLKRLERYPIVATKLSGSTTLGTFTGSIELKIIGE